MNLNEHFRKLARTSSDALGAPWLFVVNVLLILLWLAAGPFANFSDTWQLVVNTATTVFTYLAVFLIQNTQNRDSKAVHIKLDELISSVEGARNRLVDLESLSDEELERLQQQFKKLKERVSINQHDAVRAIEDDLDKLEQNLDKVEDKVEDKIDDKIEDKVEHKIEAKLER